MTQITTHHPRSGWKEDEARLLFDAVRAAAEDGRSLREVFQEVGGQLQRKPNSIRNYYYARIFLPGPRPSAPLPRKSCIPCCGKCSWAGDRGKVSAPASPGFPGATVPKCCGCRTSIVLCSKTAPSC